MYLYFHNSKNHLKNQINGDKSNNTAGTVTNFILIISSNTSFDQIISSKKTVDIIKVIQERKNDHIIQGYIFSKTYFHLFLIISFITRLLVSRISCSSGVSSIHGAEIFMYLH